MLFKLKLALAFSAAALITACGGGSDTAVVTTPPPPSVQIPLNVTTLAGSLQWGYADGTGALAKFDSPAGVAVDAAGNVYVSEYANHTIRKITAAGVVTTLAGSGSRGDADGTGSSASFGYPEALTVDANGNVYVADTWNYRIRKVTPEGVVTTIAGSGTRAVVDGTGLEASFHEPLGIAVDSNGNLFVTDNHTIRKITSAGVVTTIAGVYRNPGFSDGTGVAASFFRPTGISIDASGNLYIADTNNNLIRKMTPAGVVTTIAGSVSPGYADGTGAAALFSYPTGVTVDAAGNLFVADNWNHMIRMITAAGVVTTLAGSTTSGYAEGTGATARFNYPFGVSINSNGLLYVTDRDNRTIRKIAP
jgi:sugar lactone lactonase YvrE